MEEIPSSPRNRLKFLCSYGGRILPRPYDGLLRYVGGETRVLSVPRAVSLKDLMEKITGMFKAELVVKYQLMTEDLDALVTVKTDEDLYHMIHEYDRLERRSRSSAVASSPLFRLFLFPYPAASAAAEPSVPLDQRYVDAINGGLAIHERSHHPHPRPLFAVCSNGASPSLHGNMGGEGMHRVRSTPNLGGGGLQNGSPRAYQRPGVAFGYGGGSGFRMGAPGGFHQEIGYGCGCYCGCVGSSSQPPRKFVRSPPTQGGSPLGSLAEVSPPRRGQGFHLGPPIAGPLRRGV
ncbi:uncharacterized protein LOC110030925 [Phalaenopsis equestris]|uniref:uncharacterized protein LOC110030925 n=1 Tax=Phalaenopsis equestris TaxID=78828 RepID=UPI0009E2CE94|nr:uncharacterized protein LOC110030925 [Phalaenopsis equestris]